MVIGERNLVIGSRNVIINMFSKSIYAPFENKIVFFISIISNIFYKITEKSNSPPDKIFNLI